MSLIDSIRIAASGMTAQRARMDVAAGNLANARTTRSVVDGQLVATPYLPERVVFAASTSEPAGVAGRSVAVSEIVVIDAAPIPVYDPTHPDAGPDGFVLYPPVEPAAEMADLMESSRAYAMNATAANAAKEMAVDSIEIAR